MANSEKMATQATQDEEKQNRNITHYCVGHHYIQWLSVTGGTGNTASGYHLV
jgi:hypothetical protein